MTEKIKIALIGDTNAGKSAFIQRFRKGQFIEKLQKNNSDDAKADIKENASIGCQKKILADFNASIFPSFIKENVQANCKVSKKLSVLKEKRPCPTYTCSAVYSFSAENSKIKEKLIDITFFDAPRLQKFPMNSLEEWELDGAIGVRSADAFILLYDVTNEESFDYVTKLRCEILEVIKLVELKNFICIFYSKKYSIFKGYLMPEI